MARTPRNFGHRDAADQSWMVENTWCDHCSKADLGLIDPVEYEEDGQVYLEGKCKSCGNRVVSQIIERDANA